MTTEERYRQHAEALATDFLESIALEQPPLRHMTDRNIAIIMDVLHDRKTKGRPAIQINAEVFPWQNPVDAAIRASEENTARLMNEKRNGQAIAGWNSAR